MSSNAFPLTSLPKLSRDFVQSAAISIGCDYALVAVPSLVTAAAAIGASGEIQLKQNWLEPSTLWAGIVAPSGSGKSPALKAAISPLMAKHHEAANATSNRTGTTRRRFVTGDCTLESVAVMLAENPQGMLLARDELSGWLGAFDKYHNGKGSDAASWLSLHSGIATIVDRKKSESVYVPSPRLSLIGTIQPHVLEKCIADHVTNGMAARLLLCQPPTKVRRWTDAELSTDSADRWTAVVNQLLALREQKPITYELAGDARVEFSAWFDGHNSEAEGYSEALRALWTKLEAACARLALILHLLAWAENDTVKPPDTVMSSCSVQRAIRIVEYFKAEALQIYSAWDRSKQARELQTSLSRVQSMGGTCTEREFMRKYHLTLSEATETLQKLFKNELGRWEAVKPGKKGGRETRRLVLITVS